MPRIRDSLLDIVVYLYPSEEKARMGEAAGGTGFLVGVPWMQHTDRHHVYAVTNSHVIREGSSPVVRINTEQATDVLTLTADDWMHHPDGDDVAVALLDLAGHDQIKGGFIEPELFLTKEKIDADSIGPGDETFMIGRFAPHGGQQQNRPTVRFGNISAMPGEPVRHERGTLQESFLIETRSLGGYSGSPVFYHRPFPQVWDTGKGQEPRMRGPWAGEWFLGVDYGHLPLLDRVRDRDGKPLKDGWFVKSNSGQMGVVPAWRLLDLLKSDELAAARARAEREWIHTP